MPHSFQKHSLNRAANFYSLLTFSLLTASCASLQAGAPPISMEQNPDTSQQAPTKGAAASEPKAIVSIHDIKPSEALPYVLYFDLSGSPQLATLKSGAISAKNLSSQDFPIRTKAIKKISNLTMVYYEGSCKLTILAGGEYVTEITIHDDNHCAALRQNGVPVH